MQPFLYVPFLYILTVFPMSSQSVLLFVRVFIHCSCSPSSSSLDLLHCHLPILLSFLSYAFFLPLLSSSCLSIRFTSVQLSSSTCSLTLQTLAMVLWLANSSTLYSMSLLWYDRLCHLSHNRRSILTFLVTYTTVITFLQPH